MRRYDAELLAKVLVEADSQGHYSHGMNRLDVLYMKEIEAGLVNLAGTPRVLTDTCSSAWVDGDSCLGPTVGKYCIDMAIEKTSTTGLGWVTTKGSNHFGITGWYSMQALAHNAIGIAFTNTSPIMVPTRGQSAALGTNTIAVAAPAVDTHDAFHLDIATTTVAVGKVEMKYRAKEPMPDRWLYCRNGQLPSDEDTFMMGIGDTYFMYPVGAEATGGYKGFGLAMMVEILGGVLDGSAVGPEIRSASNFNSIADLGQTFIAVNPAMFAEGFQERMHMLVRQCRDCLTLPNEDGVIVPGDKERLLKMKVKVDGGILYNANVLKALEALAHRLGVDPIQTS